MFNHFLKIRENVFGKKGEKKIKTKFLCYKDLVFDKVVFSKKKKIISKINKMCIKNSN